MFFPGSHFFGGFPSNASSDSTPDQNVPPQAEVTKEIDNTGLYKILNVEPTADMNELKKAFRKACVKGEYCHPDKGGQPEKFKELNEAYDILKDPEKRDVYDRCGMEGLKANDDGGDPMNFFSRFFGNGRANRPQKAKPKLYEMKISLEDSFLGGTKTIPFKRNRICGSCQGQGGTNPITCPCCKGEKFLESGLMFTAGMPFLQRIVCRECHGKGVSFQKEDICEKCTGKGHLNETSNIDVDLQRGIPNDYDIKLVGEADEAPGVLPGDLYVRIFILKHKLFTRKGADLFITKKLTLGQALTGTIFEIQHLDGSQMKIAIRPGDLQQTNVTRTIKGQGMPFFNNSATRGNLYIKCQIQLPKLKNLNQAQRDALFKVLPKPTRLPPRTNTIIHELCEVQERDLNPEADAKEQISDVSASAQEIRCA